MVKQDVLLGNAVTKNRLIIEKALKYAHSVAFGAEYKWDTNPDFVIRLRFPLLHSVIEIENTS